MTLSEAIRERHTVRKYTNQKLPENVVNQLSCRIGELNGQYGLNMRLITDNTQAFGGLLGLVLAKGVRNYIVLAGKDSPDVDENLGYCGIDAALLAQMLGLNSWWVGGTFSRKKVAKTASISENEKMTGVIAIGYGAEQGEPHKSKKPSDVSKYKGSEPDWFLEGVKASLLAPTALNKQDFFIEGDGNKVSIRCGSGSFGKTDLGIVKYHFEVGAGKDNFEWTDR